MGGPERLSSVTVEGLSSAPHPSLQCFHHPRHTCCILIPILTFLYPFLPLLPTHLAGWLGEREHVWQTSWGVSVVVSCLVDKCLDLQMCTLPIDSYKVKSVSLQATWFSGLECIFCLGKCPSLAQTGKWTGTWSQPAAIHIKFPLFLKDRLN